MVDASKILNWDLWEPIVSSEFGRGDRPPTTWAEGREASVKEERTGELSRSPPASESRSLLTTFTHGALGAQGEEIHLTTVKTTVGPVAAFAGM